MTSTLEDLLVALADKLWKGARVPLLEEKVIDQVAANLRTGRWDIFVELGSAFEVALNRPEFVAGVSR